MSNSWFLEHDRTYEQWQNNISAGVRTHAQSPAVDLKSTPLTTRANWRTAKTVRRCVQPGVYITRGITIAVSGGLYVGMAVLQRRGPGLSIETCSDHY